MTTRGETDALELIRNDGPMSNLVSADRSFTVNHAAYRLAKPVALIAATDGCFGYVRTPAHFEYLLLHTLAEADDPAAWARAILRALSGFTGDDASVVVASLGCPSFAELQTSLSPRHHYLHEHHWVPFAAPHVDAAEFERLRSASWDAYRPLYHERVLDEEVAR